jgi:putative ABC transport system permease protein
MFSQIGEVTLMNLRNLGSRLGSSSVIVVGIAGVVAVLVSILAMANGFAATLERTGKPDRAIVLRGGSNGELSSGISNEHAALISQMEGIDASSAEFYTVVGIAKRATGTPANLVLRGIEESAYSIRPEVKLTAGRKFVFGKQELIAGRGAADQFEGIDLDGTVMLRDTEWRIVGLFEAGGGVNESELWGDAKVAQSVFRQNEAVTSIRLRLTSPAVIDELNARIEQDPRFDLTVHAEPEYYKAQSLGINALITNFGYLVAVIMAIGAVFAALNTMYSAVSTRTVEIATLRAIGFGGTPVVVSVMFEALLLAAFGGALGAALAYLFFNGVTISTLGGSFSQVAFDFAVTTDLMRQGLIWAITLGAVGGLFPALRAARMPITVALRGE